MLTMQLVIGVIVLLVSLLVAVSLPTTSMHAMYQTQSSTSSLQSHRRHRYYHHSYRI